MSVSKSKLKIGRVNKATIARIRGLRAALDFIKEHPSSVKTDLMHHFGWSESKSNKVLRNLIICGLIRISEPSRGHTLNKYCVTSYTETDLNRELPLDLEFSRTSGRNDADSHVRIVREWNGAPPRDPLTIYLMGTGVAPSILFNRRQHATT